MKNFTVFTDKEGKTRILRSQEPIFIGTLIDHYDGELPDRMRSKAFEMNGSMKRIRIDETYQDASESKFSWLLGRAISVLKHLDKTGHGTN